MEPLPQTQQVLALLAQDGAGELEDGMRELADRIATVVPSCVGVSLTLLGEGLTLTFVSTSPRALTLDMAQSTHGGPCVESARTGAEVGLPDLLDEDRWHEFAAAAAAQGVRSSLSLPLLDADGAVTASVNVYAAEPRAFEGLDDALRLLAGTLTGPATTNADLPFASRERARDATAELERRSVVATAVGCLLAKHQIHAEDAQLLLESQAQLAGVDLETHARAVVERLADRG